MKTSSLFRSIFFFFNDTATTEIYTLSLHALFRSHLHPGRRHARDPELARDPDPSGPGFSSETCCDFRPRSEEHTSELQSQSNLVCRLLLEKKKIPLVRGPPARFPRYPHSSHAPSV